MGFSWLGSNLGQFAGGLGSAGKSATGGSSLFGPIGLGLAGIGALFGGGKDKGFEPNPTTFQSFRTGLGDFTQEMGSFKYMPRYSGVQNKTNKREDRGILNAVNSLNKNYRNFSVNDYFNNPFFGSTFNQLMRPIETQRQQEEKQLTDMLNARGQMGSSYDALLRRDMGQRYDNLLTDATNQARQVSADAYQQQFQNALAQLAGLRNDRNAALNAAYMPMQTGAGIMQALMSNGLEQTQMGNQMNLQQSLMDNNLLTSLIGTLPDLVRTKKPNLGATT